MDAKKLAAHVDSVEVPKMVRVGNLSMAVEENTRLALEAFKTQLVAAINGAAK